MLQIDFPNLLPVLADVPLRVSLARASAAVACLGERSLASACSVLKSEETSDRAVRLRSTRGLTALALARRSVATLNRIAITRHFLSTNIFVINSRYLITIL